MEAFVREAFTLLGIGLFVIGLRLSVRISAGGLKGLHPDDYLMVVAAVRLPCLFRVVCCFSRSVFPALFSRNRTPLG